MNPTSQDNPPAEYNGHHGGVTNAGTKTNATSGIGEKIKGAIQVVHGIGENVRGTALGAVDTVAHHGESKNDEIARKGRVEMEQGLAALRGRGTTTTGTQISGQHNVTGTVPHHDGRINPTSAGLPSGGVGQVSGVPPHFPNATGPGTEATGTVGPATQLNHNRPGGVEADQNVYSQGYAQATPSTGPGPNSTGFAHGAHDTPSYGQRHPDQQPTTAGLHESLHHAPETSKVDVQQGPSIENSSGGPAVYHHRDDAVTDLNAPPGQVDHGASQYSTGQKTPPSYLRNEGFNMGSGTTSTANTGVGGESLHVADRQG